MAETPQHAPSTPSTPHVVHRLRSRIVERWRAVVTAVERVVHRQVHRLTVLVFVGGGAALGIETFSMYLALWPLFPTMVPLVLLASGVAFTVVGAIRTRTRRDRSLSYRPGRRAPWLR